MTSTLLRTDTAGQPHHADGFAWTSMNLDALTPGTTDAPLAASDWTMEVIPDGGNCIGVVRRSDAVMCRIMLAGAAQNQAGARAALAARARVWIASYLARSTQAS